MAKRSKAKVVSDLLANAAELVAEMEETPEPVTIAPANETTKEATIQDFVEFDDETYKYAIADFIKTKSMDLHYDPSEDCFTFTKSAWVGLTDTSAKEIIVEEDWEEFVGMKSVKAGGNLMVPHDADMDKINQYTSRPHSKGEVRRVIIMAAGTGRDRHGERNRPKALQTGAQISVGKAIMDNHAVGDVDKTWGRIYDAKTMRTKSGGMVLVQKGFMLNDSEHQPLIRKLEAGIGSSASVHYKVKRANYHCSFCNKPMFGDRVQGQQVEHQAASPPSHPKAQITFCGHYVGLSKNDKGEICEGHATDWDDYMETTRTSAPAYPSAEFKIKMDGIPLIEEAMVKTESAPPAQIVPPAIRSLSDFAKSLAQSTVLSLPTLATDSEKGAIAVSEDDKAKTAGQPAPDAAVDAAASAAAPSDDVAKFIEGFGKLNETVGSFSGNIDTLKTVIAAAADVVGKQALMTESFQKAVEVEKQAREEQVKEMSAKFEVLMLLHQDTANQLADLTRKCDMQSSKSLEELVQKLAAVAPQATSEVQNQQKALTQDPNTPYATMLDRVMKAMKR